jgi:cobalt/nickel transport system permease protein
VSGISLARDQLRALDALAAGAPLHLDPRALLLTTLAFVAVVVSFHRYALTALLPLALFPVVVTAAGRVPVHAMLRAVALALPFAALVGAFNPVFDRALLPVPLPLSLQFAGGEIAGGWFSFASILLRAVLTVAAAFALIAVVGMVNLSAALTALRLPAVFTQQLLFLYRYLFVQIEEASAMATARELRSSGTPATLRVWAPLVGHLLLRSVDRARRIHRAMLARGFDGQLGPLRVSRPLRWTWRDSVFVLSWCGFFALARAVDLPYALGRLIGL